VPCDDGTPVDDGGGVGLDILKLLLPLLLPLKLVVADIAPIGAADN
jgi:hypothetical protein